MFVSRVYQRGFFQKLSESKTNFFTSLWNKPVTRDERIKGYIPEVVEESLLEEKAVQLEHNARDIIVELGNKIIVEIEKKSPTSRIAPYLNKLLKEYGTTDVIRQRPLSYLIYPTSSVLSPSPDSCHELVLSFSENFKEMIEEIERSGCSAKVLTNGKNFPLQERSVQSRKGNAPPLLQCNDTIEHSPTGIGDTTLSNSLSTDNAGCDQENREGKLDENSSCGTDSTTIVNGDSYEPLDITLFVKVMTGMTLANISCSDYKSALKCVNAALLHAKDSQRIGGLFGIKAGILVREKKFEEAVIAAQKAVEISQNLQGFLQGTYALHQLNRIEDELKFLEQGKDCHPMNQQIAKRYDEIVQSLPEPLLRLEEPTSETV